MKLHVESSGDGPRTVALLHGLSKDGSIFDAMTGYLVSAGYTVLRPDLRGHGLSPRADSYDIAEFADDVAETLPRGLDLVMGNALGGAVLVRAIGRLDAGRAVYLDPGFVVGPLTEAEKAERLAKANDKAIARMALTMEFPDWSEAQVDRAALAIERCDLDAMIEQLFASLAADPTPAHRPVCPSLVLMSDHTLPPLGATEPEPQMTPPDLQIGLLRLGWEVRTQPGAYDELFASSLDNTIACLTGWI